MLSITMTINKLALLLLLQKISQMVTLLLLTVVAKDSSEMIISSWIMESLRKIRKYQSLYELFMIKGIHCLKIRLNYSTLNGQMSKDRKQEEIGKISKFNNLWKLILNATFFNSVDLYHFQVTLIFLNK